MSHRAGLLWILAVSAITLYAIGFKTGTIAVIIIAAVVELWFWFKLIFADKQAQTPTDQ